MPAMSAEPRNEKGGTEEAEKEEDDEDDDEDEEHDEDEDDEGSAEEESEEDGTDEDDVQNAHDEFAAAAAGAALAAGDTRPPVLESTNSSDSLFRRIRRTTSDEREGNDEDEKTQKVSLLEIADGVDQNLKNALTDAMHHAKSEKAAEKQRQMEDVFGRVFDQLDADQGGTLDVDGELLQTMQKLGLQDMLLKDLRIAMEQVVQRKHDRVERVGMFQKRLCWDYMFKEEFIKVMVIMSEPEAINKQKEAEETLFDIFQQFDEDRSGTIDCNELGKAMEKMGRPMTEDQIENLIVQIDSEGTGAINFVDFAAIFGIKATPIDYEATHRADLLAQLAEARATFKTFDFDHSESIDIHELKAIMLAMGRKLSEDQLQKMMNTVDLDGSGEIDFQEFCALLGIEWDEQFGLDLKEIDAFSKANAPKDQNKRKQSVTKGRDENREVSDTDNMVPCGMTVTSDPVGYKFLKFSPNGNFLAICGFDATVKIYEVKENGKTQRMCSLREHTHTVLGVDWSPLSDRVVTVAADRMLHMWHVKKEICVQSVKAHAAYVRCVEWSRDGSMIATCSSDKTVKLWSPVTLQQTKLMLGHSNWVRIVRFREDSKRLVSAGDDNYLIVWTVPEGQILQRITNLRSPVSDLCLLLRAGYALPPLVIGCLNGDVSIYHPDVGLHGFMHYTIIGVENMYPSPKGMQRYIVFEIGRNKHRLRTVPEQADSFDYESHTDKMVSCRSEHSYACLCTNAQVLMIDESFSSMQQMTGTHMHARTHTQLRICSVWDMNEVVRLQLFEKRPGEVVRLMGEFKTTHKEAIAHYADGIQQVWRMCTCGA